MRSNSPLVSVSKSILSEKNLDRFRQSELIGGGGALTSSCGCQGFPAISRKWGGEEVDNQQHAGAQCKPAGRATSKWRFAQLARFENLESNIARVRVALLSLHHLA